MATSITLTTSNASTNYTLSTGARGPAGPAGAGAELTSYETQVESLPDYPATFPPTIGSGAGDAVAGNDSRLTNSRTPTAHKSSHATGGSDAMTAADIGAMANTNAAVVSAIATNPSATIEALDQSLATSLADYRAAMAAQARPSILCIGDSMIGTAETQLHRSLVAELGISGYGLLTAGLSGGATTSLIDPTQWVSGITHTLPLNGEIEFSLIGVNPVEGNTFKFYYLTKPGSGKFKIMSQVEGGSYADETGIGVAGVVDADGALAGSVITITKSGAGTYRKRWKFKAVGLGDGAGGAGEVVVIGGGIRDAEQAGALITFMPNGSNGQNEIDDVLATPSAVLNPIIRDLAPNLIIHSNLDGATINNTSLGAYLDKLVDATESSDGLTPSTIIVGPPPFAGSAQDALNVAQAEAQRAIAKSRGDAFWDNRMWALPIANALAKGYIMPEIDNDPHYTDAAHNQWVPAMLNYFGINKDPRGHAAMPYLAFGQGLNNNLRPYIRIDKNTFAVGGQSLELLGTLRITNHPAGGAAPSGGQLGTLILEDRLGAISNGDVGSIYYSGDDIFFTAAGVTMNYDPAANGSLWLPGSTLASPTGQLGKSTTPWGVLYVGNIACVATAGTKIGTATTQKIAFWNADPVVQPAANADTSGATLGELETEVNELKAMLRTIGLLAP
jgi:hypothetical protein